MPYLKGEADLKQTFSVLKNLSEKIRENLEEKRNWIMERSDTWQESDAASEWEDHLDKIEGFLDDLDSLEFPA